MEPDVTAIWIYSCACWLLYPWKGVWFLHQKAPNGPCLLIYLQHSALGTAHLAVRDGQEEEENSTALHSIPNCNFCFSSLSTLFCMTLLYSHSQIFPCLSTSPPHTPVWCNLSGKLMFIACLATMCLGKCEFSVPFCLRIPLHPPLKSTRILKRNGGRCIDAEALKYSDIPPTTTF